MIPPNVKPVHEVPTVTVTVALLATAALEYPVPQLNVRALLTAPAGTVEVTVATAAPEMTSVVAAISRLTDRKQNISGLPSAAFAALTASRARFSALRVAILWRLRETYKLFVSDLPSRELLKNNKPRAQGPGFVKFNQMQVPYSGAPASASSMGGGSKPSVAWNTMMRSPVSGSGSASTTMFWPARNSFHNRRSESGSSTMR